jgi:AcrR family transcriptional regulator
MADNSTVLTQIDTKKRILDAAERLFARNGFQGTSMRAITGEAKANLAAVNYHFGTKEALLEAVFERRLVPLNKTRTDRLEAVRDSARSEARRPSARDVLRAFIEPTIAFAVSKEGAGDFPTLIGRAIIDPDDAVRKIFLRHVGPVFHLLIDALREALPELSAHALFWRVHFTIGAMGHTCHIRTMAETMQTTGKPHGLPDGVAAACDAEAMTEMLMNFVSAGMEA